MNINNAIVIEKNFEVTSLKNETLKGIRAKFEKYRKECKHIDDDGKIEIYTDYRDRELGKDALEKIFEADDPEQMFYDVLNDGIDVYEWGLWDELINDLKAELDDDEIEFWEDDDNTEEVNEIVRDLFYWDYDYNDFNQNVKVNIMVDCGNANSDFSDDNFGYYGHRGDVPETSSMLWLARQQGKEEQFKAAVKSWYNGTTEYVDRDTYDDPFIESMIQEAENLPSELGTLTFLVSMPLFDLFKCLNIKAKEYDKKFHYEPQLNENAKSYIVLDKKTECGLFNSWDGGGSCLEIELDKDVELPLKYCKFAVDGCRMQGRWDVNEVYGLINSCWKETLKEIKEVG